MATKVIAPRLGEGVNELTVVRWLKQEGEPVKELESLLEVETDKVITEIPSPASGTLLKRLVEENAVTEVGSVIARAPSRWGRRGASPRRSPRPRACAPSPGRRWCRAAR